MEMTSLTSTEHNLVANYANLSLHEQLLQSMMLAHCFTPSRQIQADTHKNNSTYDKEHSWGKSKLTPIATNFM